MSNTIQLSSSWQKISESSIECSIAGQAIYDILEDSVSVHPNPNSNIGIPISGVRAIEVKDGNAIWMRSQDKDIVRLTFVDFYKGGGTGEGGTELVLGESSINAYRGDRGKIAYDHSQVVIGNPHGTSKIDIGLDKVDNTSDIDKEVSMPVQDALDLKLDISNALTIGSTETTAFQGKLGADHISNVSNPHNVTKAQLGINDYQGHLMSVRRLSTTQNMQSGTPLTINGTVIKYPSTENSINHPASAVFTLASGKNYRVSAANMYVQSTGANSSFSITIQYSNDGITWISHPISRNITIKTNDETIDPSIIFKVYKSEFTTDILYFRFMPNIISGGVNYSVGLEIEEV